MKKLISSLYNYILFTIITLGFFLGLLYFGFFTGRELLVHLLVSKNEYAYTQNQWQFNYCEEDVAYVFEDKPKSFVYSGEVILNTDEGKEKYIKTCKSKIIDEAGLQRLVDFQRAISKYGFPFIVFLVLFTVSYLQTRKMYIKLQK